MENQKPRTLTLSATEVSLEAIINTVFCHVKRYQACEITLETLQAIWDWGQGLTDRLGYDLILLNPKALDYTCVEAKRRKP